MSESGTPGTPAGQGSSSAAPDRETPASDPAAPAPELGQLPPALGARANPPDAAASSAAVESTGGTLYAQAQALYEQQLTRPQIAEELTRRGADAESVQVVLNTLPGAPQPQALPEVHFDQSVNPLSPQLLSVLDMGLQGDRVTVALYWLTFGGVLGVFMTIVLAVGETDFLTSTSGAWASFAMHALPWVGYPLAAFAIVRAVFLLFRRRL
jgi:hypothetical protein